ncbi:MAG: sigma-54 dependent transcriptional regulator [bacterium]|nr:sigma-54 dependent transcriptional regulator [bacterium]
MSEANAAESNSENVVVVLNSRRAANWLARAGWETREIASPSEFNGLREGRSARVIVVGCGRSGPERTAEVVEQLHAAAPLVDVVVWRAGASADFVRASFRAGAHDVVLGDTAQALVEATEQAFQRQRLLPQVENLSRARHRSGRFEGMLSRNDVMWDIFMTITRTAATEATVLVTGETGTGKDLVARAIHRRSGRDGRFVAVNCSSIRPEIVESELFGHERGAFTGANQSKEGLFRHADGGTLLLDEIGDMPGEAQLSLLRVLQEERIRPVGATREVPVNVRVVAATNAPLTDQVRDGSFREDLFYRLDVIRIEIPPLRDRREDVLYLFGHLLRTHCKRYGVDRPHLNQGFIDRLTEYDWPGNVRQLENVTERLVLEGDRETLAPRDLNRVLPKTEESATARPASDRVPQPVDSKLDTEIPLATHLDTARERIEREYLEAVLTEQSGQVLKAAELAGISRRTMFRKMKEHGLDKQDYRP